MPTLPGSFDFLSFYRTSNRFEQTNPLDLPWSKTSFEASEDNQELTAPDPSRKGLDSDDDEEEDGEEEEEQKIVGGGKIIHFQHTKKEVCTDQDFS